MDISLFVPRIKAILKESDINTVSAKRVRRQIETEFGANLEPVKKEFDALIVKTLNDMVAAGEIAGFSDEAADAQDQASSSSASSVNSVDNVKEEPKIKEEPAPQTQVKTEIKTEPTSSLFSNGFKNDDWKKIKIQKSTNSAASSSSDAARTKKESKGTKRVLSDEYVEDSDDEGASSSSTKRPRRATALKAKSKSAPAKSATGRGGGGFNTPAHLSDKLCTALGLPPNSSLPRSQVVSKLWEHIKTNNLQDPKDRRVILCDAKLKELFGKNKVNSFGMNKDLSKHIFSAGSTTRRARSETEDDEDEESEAEETEFSETDEEIVRPQKRREKGKAKVKRVTTRSKSSGSRANASNPFNKPMIMDDGLCEVLGEPHGSQLSRPQIVKRIWDYIKANNLQDPGNKQKIICDEKLHRAFGVPSTDMFKMNKIISTLIRPATDSDNQPSTDMDVEEDVKKEENMHMDESASSSVKDEDGVVKEEPEQHVKQEPHNTDVKEEHPDVKQERHWE